MCGLNFKTYADFGESTFIVQLVKMYIRRNIILPLDLVDFSFLLLEGSAAEVILYPGHAVT